MPNAGVSARRGRTASLEMSERDSPSELQARMQALERDIAKALESQKYWTVVQSEIERVWPPSAHTRKHRHQEITALAKKRGWIATIIEEGAYRVVFQRQNS